QRALQRIRLRTITPAARAEHRRDHAASKVDSSDNVVFGVRHVEAAAGGGQPLWTGQRRTRAGAAVTGVALLTRARNMMHATAVAIDAVDGVPLAKREEEVTLRVDGNRSRSVQRCATQRCAIGRRLPFARATERLDPRCREIDAPDPVIANVADQQVPL